MTINFGTWKAKKWTCFELHGGLADGDNCWPLYIKPWPTVTLFGFGYANKVWNVDYVNKDRLCHI